MGTEEGEREGEAIEKQEDEGGGRDAG